MSTMPGPSPPLRKPRQVRTELDRLLMDEGTVNMLCGTTPRTGTTPATALTLSNTNTKKAKLEALQLKRLQVLSTVKNRSGDSTKKLREKKKPEMKFARRRSEEGCINGNAQAKGPLGSWFKGRRASLLATLKEDRNGADGSTGNKMELVEGLNN